MKALNNTGIYILDVTHKDDRYNTTSQLYQYKPYDRSPRAHTTTHFFTDRAIYRPGQTVYFKGIKIHHDDDKHTLVKEEIFYSRIYGC